MTAAAPGRRGSRAGWLVGFLLTFGLLLSSGHLHLTDEEQTAQAAGNLWRGIFTVSRSQDPGGNYIYGIPTLLITALARGLVPAGGPLPELPLLGPPLLAFAVAGFFYFRTGLLLGLTPRRSAAAVLLLTVGSNYAVWADSIKDEAFLIPLLAAFSYYLLAYARDRAPVALWLATLAYGAALLTKPAFAVTLPLLAFWLWWRAAGPARYRILALLLVCVLIVMANNWVRFGRLAGGYAPFLPTGKPQDLSFPLLTGLAGHLFSPLRSVILYNPFLLLALAGLIRAARAKRVPPGSGLLAGCALAYLVLISKWTVWEGEVGFGNRLALPVALLLAPFLLVAVRELSFRWLAPLVLLVGLLVNLPGHLVDVATYYQNPDRARDLVTLVREEPLHPAAWWQQYEMTALAVHNLIVNLDGLDLGRLAAIQPDLPRLDRLEYFFWRDRLDLWCVYGYYRQVPLALILVGGGVLLGVNVVCIVQLFRRRGEERER